MIARRERELARREAIHQAHIRAGCGLHEYREQAAREHQWNLDLDRIEQLEAEVETLKAQLQVIQGGELPYLESECPDLACVPA